MFTVALEKVVYILVLVLSSIGFRFLLQRVGQRWICTFAHTTTITILPVITYIITSVISRDIALSLGMVGALSIVRFRNPVRSPFELSVYFGSITMGISAAVGMQWLLYFVASILLTTIILIFVSKIYQKHFNKKLFVSSFTEGNMYCSLEINCTDKIELLDSSVLLKSKVKSSGQINYLLMSDDFEKLKIILDKVEENPLIIGYQLSD